MRRLWTGLGLSALAILAGLIVVNPRLIAQANERIFGSPTSAGGGDAIALTATSDGYLNVLCPDCGGGGGNLSGTLTAGRIPYASGAQTLVDSANLIWDSTILPYGQMHLGGVSLRPYSANPQLLTDVQWALTGTITDPADLVSHGGLINFTLNPSADSLNAFHGLSVQLGVPSTNTRDIGNAYSAEVVAVHNGSGPVASWYAVMIDTANNGLGAMTALYGLNISALNSGGGTVAVAYGVKVEDMAAYPSTTMYPFWSDEQGVFRIRSDNTFDSVYQAIPALYNPQFTKYTPGAANYERCIPGCQWNGNVAEIGTEKGGTGTLRSSKFIGTSMELAAITTATGFKPDAITAHTALLQAYDTDTGPGYVTFGTLLNGNAPSLTFAPPAGGGTMNFQGIYKSNDGTSGLTGTCTIAGLLTVTVKNGLITACS